MPTAIENQLAPLQDFNLNFLTREGTSSRAEGKKIVPFENPLDLDFNTAKNFAASGGGRLFADNGKLFVETTNYVPNTALDRAKDPVGLGYSIQEYRLKEAHASPLSEERKIQENVANELQRLADQLPPDLYQYVDYGKNIRASGLFLDSPEVLQKKREATGLITGILPAPPAPRASVTANLKNPVSLPTPAPLSNNPVSIPVFQGGSNSVSSPFDLSAFGGFNSGSSLGFQTGVPVSSGGAPTGVGGILGDIFGSIPGVGGVLGPLGSVLGGVVDAAGGILGGLLGGGQNAGLGSLLGGLLGGGSANIAGGSIGGALGGLFGPLAILGLAKLLGGTSLGENRQEVKVTLPAPTAEELQLLGINIDLARNQLQAFQTALGGQRTQQNLLNAIFGEERKRQVGAENASQQVFGQNFASALGASDVGRLSSELDFRNQQQALQDLLAEDFRRGNIASPQDLARIQQATDLATEQGLSDLRKFQTDALDQVRLSAGARGLRPSDSPILSGFGDVVEESGRQAQQLIAGLRQKQLESELAFPLARGQLGLGQFGAANTALQNQRQLEQAILQANAANRINLGNTAAGLGTGLATGGGAASTLAGLQQTRAAGRSTSQVGQQNPLTTGAQIGALFGL